jgi:ribosome biogenesis GTPase
VEVGELMREEEGRHTTTASRLYDCIGGGHLIESPGVRDYAPSIDDIEPVSLGFHEVLTASAGCRFQDCKHLNEPQCAVRAAAESGAIGARRYESYRRMRRLYDRLGEQRGPSYRPRR